MKTWDIARVRVPGDFWRMLHNFDTAVFTLCSGRCVPFIMACDMVATSRSFKLGEGTGVGVGSGMGTGQDRCVRNHYLGYVSKKARTVANGLSAPLFVHAMRPAISFSHWLLLSLASSPPVT